MADNDIKNADNILKGIEDGRGLDQAILRLCMIVAKAGDADVSEKTATKEAIDKKDLIYGVIAKLPKLISEGKIKGEERQVDLTEALIGAYLSTGLRRIETAAKSAAIEMIKHGSPKCMEFLVKMIKDKSVSEIARCPLLLECVPETAKGLEALKSLQADKAFYKRLKDDGKEKLLDIRIMRLKEQLNAPVARQTN